MKPVPKTRHPFLKERLTEEERVHWVACQKNLQALAELAESYAKYLNGNGGAPTAYQLHKLTLEILYSETYAIGIRGQRLKAEAAQRLARRKAKKKA